VFSASLAAGQGSTPAERRTWRDGVYAVIQTMTILPQQGELTIERICVLAGVSRAGYYRHWATSAPRAEETGLRDAIQRLALAHRHCGYRRIAAQLRREGFAVNRKRVLRLMQQDNLLRLRQKPFVPVTTDSRHAWRVVWNLARRMVPGGLDQLWVADITYIRLQEEFVYLASFSMLSAGAWSAGTWKRIWRRVGDRRALDGDQDAPADARQLDPPLRPRHQYAAATTPNCFSSTTLLPA
jgi:hypothetical protein